MSRLPRHLPPATVSTVVWVGILIDVVGLWALGWWLW